MKTCIKCKVEKALTEFYSPKNTCKPCFIAQANKRHWTNREESLAYKRKHTDKISLYTFNKSVSGVEEM